MQLRPIDNGGLPSFLSAPTPGGTTCHADRTRSRSLTKIAISLLLMSQLVGRVPGFIFVPPHPVFFGTSLVLAPTSRSAETVYFRTPSHLPGSSLHAKKSNQPISTPNGAVGSLRRSIFVPPLSFGFFHRLTVVDFFVASPTSSVYFHFTLSDNKKN